MSYFLFGKCTSKQTSLSEQAGDVGLCLTSYVPDIVHQMLDAAGSGNEGVTKFLIVAQASDDTSDQLISPFQMASEAIYENLGKVQRWLELIVGGTDIHVTLYVSDGFSDKFEDIVVPARAFQAELSNLLQREGDWPSLRVQVEPN